MAVTATGVAPARRVSVGSFARLKLRVLANGFRGQTWRVVLFILGGLGGLYFGGAVFLVFLLSAAGTRPELAVVVPVFGGATLVLGWFFVPLVWTGVDETLDPTRFALLPLPRRTLVAGLLVGALLGIPAVVTLIATAGLVGFDVAEGRAGAAASRLLIAAATVALLLWWWSRTLESAMLGSASGGASRARRTAPGGAVAQLYPRLLGRLPRNQYGALVAREARYWRRDPRRWTSLITIVVVGVVVPVMVNFGSMGFGAGSGYPLSPGMAAASMLVVGALAAVSLANQFGFDGTAYAAHLVVGVPGRAEMRARMAAFSLIMVPLLVLIATVFPVVLGDPAMLPALLGGLFAAYGTGLAVNQLISIFGAYALPETSNPFIINTGAGVAKSLLSLVALVGGLALAAPVAVAAMLLPVAWSWVLLPVGVGYGVGAAVLGAYFAGDALDRRAPELLAAVTPRR